MKFTMTNKEYTKVITFKLPASRDFVKGGSKLSPWWVTGITDAEGNFSIALQEPRKCSCAFKVTQKGHSMGILYDLKRYFKCGKVIIDNRKFNAYKFIVTKNEDLFNIIIPHFEKYPLETSKNLDFLDFKKVVLMCKEGLHLINDNREKINFIKNNMNSKRSFDQRWHFHEGSEYKKLNNEWVQAFIDGEGTFQFNVYKTSTKNKSYCVLTPSLEIAQSNHEIKVLYRIKKFFNMGYLKPKYDINNIDAAKSSRSVNRYILLQYSTVIEFVNKYPMLTCKHLDYEDWKKLIELKDKKAYKTSEGSLEMWKIKNSMNRQRVTLTIELNVNKFDKSDKSDKNNKNDKQDDNSKFDTYFDAFISWLDTLILYFLK